MAILLYIITALRLEGILDNELCLYRHSVSMSLKKSKTVLGVFMYLFKSVEVEIIERKIDHLNHFQVYNWVAFNTARCYTTIVSAYFQFLSSTCFNSHFVPPDRNHAAIRRSLPITLLSPQALATTNVLLVSIDVPIPDVSYKWNRRPHAFRASLLPLLVCSRFVHGIARCQSSVPFSG